MTTQSERGAAWATAVLREAAPSWVARLRNRKVRPVLSLAWAGRGWLTRSGSRGRGERWPGRTAWRRGGAARGCGPAGWGWAAAVEVPGEGGGGGAPRVAGAGVGAAGRGPRERCGSEAKRRR